MYAFLYKLILYSFKIFLEHSTRASLFFDQPSTHSYKPVSDDEPNTIILHCGTNSLRSNETELQISQAIFNKAKSIRSTRSNVCTSCLIARGDDLESNRMKTKLLLCGMCSEEKIAFVDHPNILAGKHLNGSKLLHLNPKGDSILPTSILEASITWLETPSLVSTDFRVVENSEKNSTELNATLGFHENANRKGTEEPITALKNLRLKKHNGTIIAYLNINSIRNRFVFLKLIISSSIDLLAIGDTKLDDTFPTSQFI